MDAKDILKAILDQKGMITITASDLKRSQAKQIGVIESWDDQGNRIYNLYTHEGKKPK